MPPIAPDESNHAYVQRIRREVNGLETIDIAEARAAGALPKTSTYHTRLIGQCEMLLNALKSEGGKVVLVRTKSGIAIWRPKA